ncbi:MAG TPA: hypothetical protein VEB88_05380 [Candidatus Acidoferrales bacterium]|nr:hypothetical protein [Candidatus Acidoferrales bacterium]
MTLSTRSIRSHPQDAVGTTSCGGRADAARAAPTLVTGGTAATNAAEKSDGGKSSSCIGAEIDEI